MDSSTSLSFSLCLTHASRLGVASQNRLYPFLILSSPFGKTQRKTGVLQISRLYWKSNIKLWGKGVVVLLFWKRGRHCKCATEPSPRKLSCFLGLTVIPVAKKLISYNRCSFVQAFPSILFLVSLLNSEVQFKEMS